MSGTGNSSGANGLLLAVTSALLLPVLLMTMLPIIIFGPLNGDGSESLSGIVNDDMLYQNYNKLELGVSRVLSDGLSDVLERIETDFEFSGCDEMIIENPYENSIVFNANSFISMYCACKENEIEEISIDDLETLLRKKIGKLYSYSYNDSTREVSCGEDPETKEPLTKTITVRKYTIQYNGESYFSDEVFELTVSQKQLAAEYAVNLSVLLNDGSYQSLAGYELLSQGMVYDGLVFTDGETRVVYYNQLDERWKNSPYGTDTIGGYACGPTAMAIVISSLTAQTVDPAYMARWSYENGYWCAGSGSYRTLISNAATDWNLQVENCKNTEPQRIIDALADGELVVAIMTKGHFTSSGHFIVLRGITSDGKVLVADPASYKRSEKEWDLSVILN